MTDNEIIKALECCKNRGWFPCGDCHKNRANGVGVCIGLNPNALWELINQQKAEIERLKSMNQSKLDIIHDVRTDLETAKSEAIKDFVKELVQNLDGEIEDYGNAGQRLNVYAWLNYYLRSKGAIESEELK